jgi:hypothetical protein
VTTEFKRAVARVEASWWKPLGQDGEQEWAEVCFVPDPIGHSRKAPEYRYLAIREPLRQRVLPGCEEQEALPLATVPMGGELYKVFGVVTTLAWEGEAVISWLRERCGKSEEAHAVMKEDLAGGKLPSGDFGENAAWWSIMILAFNLNAVMKKLVLRAGWESKRMKALRFGLIHLPGRVLEHARRLRVRLSSGHPAIPLLRTARQQILQLAQSGAG